MEKFVTLVLLQAAFLISMDLSVETAPATLSESNLVQENLTENHLNISRKEIPLTQIYKHHTKPKKIKNRARCLGDARNRWRCFFSCSWCHRIKLSSSFSSFMGVTNMPNIPQDVDYYSPDYISSYEHSEHFSFHHDDYDDLDYLDVPDDPQYLNYPPGDTENPDYNPGDPDNPNYNPSEPDYLEYHYEEHDYGQYYEYNYNHEEYPIYDFSDNSNEYFDNTDFQDEWDPTAFTSSLSYSTSEYDYY